MKIQLSKIPSVTKILGSNAIGSSKINRSICKFFTTFTQNKIRSNEIKDLKTEFSESDLDPENLGRIIVETINRELPQNKRVINGTGIILHTGLGRAPLSENAIKSLVTGAGYNLVQADRLTSDRSLRENLIQEIITQISGAEATTVINNNAAATFLMLRALCQNKEVIISRGQLVEIGGSYRMPDIMQESGCVMKEVGTTNKTHLRDYEEMISENTGAILFVHQSNFKIEGFSSQPDIFDLCQLGKRYNVPVLADLGSGALLSLENFGLPHETTVKEAIDAGVTVCCYSGDKLVGGPQAGLLSGNKNAIDKIRADSFSRMFRVCKLTLRSLEATLLEFLDHNTILNIPIYKMLAMKISEIEIRAEKIRTSLSKFSNLIVKPTEAYLGGGSVPQSKIESRALCFSFKSTKEAEYFSRALRFSTPAVFPRTSNSEVLIDLRTIDPNEDTDLIAAIQHLEIHAQ